MRRIAAASFAGLAMCSCQLAFSTVGSWTRIDGPPSPIATDNAVALPDGRVAFFRGFVQLYDPSTNAWTKGAVMPDPFVPEVVAVLQDGTVLLEGGLDQNDNPRGMTWIYDPSRNTWTQAGSVIEPRSGPASAVLTDGRVLIAGGGLPLSQPITLPNGAQVNFQATTSAEIFDPQTRKWSKAGNLESERDGIGLVALGGGGALAAGGCQGHAGFQPPVATAEVFDPATLSWSPTAPVPKPVCGATSMALRDGRALIVDQFGFLTPYGFQFSSSFDSFVYDPKARQWSATGQLAGGGSRAVMLDDGRVMVPETRQGTVKGHTFDETVGGQIFDPATNQWTFATTTSVLIPIAYLFQSDNQLSVPLPNGEALVLLPTATLVYHARVPPPPSEVLDSTGLTFELGAAALVIVLLLVLAYRRAIRSNPSKLT